MSRWNREITMCERIAPALPKRVHRLKLRTAPSNVKETRVYEREWTVSGKKQVLAWMLWLSQRESIYEITVSFTPGNREKVLGHPEWSSDFISASEARLDMLKSFDSTAADAYSYYCGELIDAIDRFISKYEEDI